MSNSSSANILKNQLDNNEYGWLSDDNMFHLVPDGEPYYEKDLEGNEIYPENNGDQVCVVTSNGPIYAINALNHEIYPKDKHGNEKPIVTENGNVQYATDADGNEYYPQNADGIDIFFGKYALTAVGMIKYPLDINKRPRYAKDPITGDEIYHEDEISEFVIMGKDEDGNQVYARKANGDEYYPATYIHAKTKDGLPIYAVSASGQVIFPQDEDGNEYYLKDDRGLDFIYSGGKVLTKYAQDKSHNEIYPIKEVVLGSGTYFELFLGGKYAKYNNEPYYPLDAYGNEYTVIIQTNGQFDEKASLPISYPITNDKWVIVPNVENKPYILQNGIPHIKNQNILGKLFRDQIGFYDFITNVASIRDSRGNQKRYKILPTGSAKEEIKGENGLGNPISSVFRRPVVKKIPNAINPAILPKTEYKWPGILIIIILLVLGIFFLYQSTSKS